VSLLVVGIRISQGRTMDPVLFWIDLTNWEPRNGGTWGRSRQSHATIFHLVFHSIHLLANALITSPSLGQHRRMQQNGLVILRSKSNGTNVVAEVGAADYDCCEVPHMCSRAGLPTDRIQV